MGFLKNREIKLIILLRCNFHFIWIWFTLQVLYLIKLMLLVWRSYNCFFYLKFERLIGKNQAIKTRSHNKITPLDHGGKVINVFNLKKRSWKKTIFFCWIFFSLIFQISLQDFFFVFTWNFQLNYNCFQHWYFLHLIYSIQKNM